MYGIYDMVGGAYERVMGLYRGSGAASPWGASAITYVGNVAGFTSTTKPASKYYDEYIGTTETSQLGKACSGGICYGHSLTETEGWYSDYVLFVDPWDPWYQRGGYYGSEGGIFTFSHSTGGKTDSSASFRVVLK